MNIFSKTSTKSSKIFMSTMAKSINQNHFTLDTFILGKDETLKPKFTKIFDVNYAVHVYYLRIQHPELNLENNTIIIYLPIQYKNNNNQTLLNIILEKMYTKIAENEIENMMEKARHILGFAPENYEIKKISSSLATCNKDTQTITFSPNIVMYAKNIIEYIVFHEFCHLKYKTHSQKFYKILAEYFPNYQKLDKQLCNLKY